MDTFQWIDKMEPRLMPVVISAYDETIISYDPLDILQIYPIRDIVNHAEHIEMLMRTTPDIPLIFNF